MPRPDGTPTEREIQQHYYAALDSVNLVNQLEAKGRLTEDEEDTVQRNKSHLRHMLRQEFWTIEDLSPLIAAAGGAGAPVILPKLKADGMRRLAQNYMDEAARDAGYRDIVDASLNALSANRDLKAEGERFLAFREQVLLAVQPEADKVERDERTPPTKDELIATLPEKPAGRVRPVEPVEPVGGRP